MVGAVGEMASMKRHKLWKMGEKLEFVTVSRPLVSSAILCSVNCLDQCETWDLS